MEFKGERKLASVSVAQDFLYQMMVAGFTTAPDFITCVDGLPEDARYIYSYEDKAHVQLVFMSDSFEALKDGEMIPSIDVSFSRQTLSPALIDAIKRELSELE